LYLLLSDRTGELQAKAWDQPEQTAALFHRDDIVKVRGAVELYNDRPQLIVQRIREDGEFQEADFCPVSARDPEQMFQELLGFVDSVGNDYVRSLLQSVLNDPLVVTAIRVAPGGLRHPCRGGLLDHVTSVCQLADKVIEHYPRLNRDWLIAGAILHDIGKVEELGTSRRLGYTTRGQLVGHVALGLEILQRHVARLQEFLSRSRTCCSTSLSATTARSIEAHCGDRLRRKPLFFTTWMSSTPGWEQAWRLIDQGPPAEEWTAYVPSLERQLYRWCPLAEDLDPCPPTNGARLLRQHRSKTLSPVEDNGHR
jgi:putative nucleotidyltransferase with HDIG domain